MDMGVRTVLQPPTGRCLEIVKVLESPASEKIMLYVLERSFDFPFRLGPFWHTGDGFALVVGNKCSKRRIIYRLSRLPAQYNSFFVIIQALPGCAVEVRETVLMASNQGKEISALGKIDILPSGKAQNIRKTIDHDLAAALEINGIWTPVHLSL